VGAVSKDKEKDWLMWEKRIGPEQARGKQEKEGEEKGRAVGCLEAFSPNRFREQEIIFYFSNLFISYKLI
jgi:hypothetical protein